MNIEFWLINWQGTVNEFRYNILKPKMLVHIEVVHIAKLIRIGRFLYRIEKLL